MRDIKEIQKVTKEIMATGLIKLSFDGKEMREHLWAKPLTRLNGTVTTARLENIPFQDGISLHDIVEVNGEREIVRVIKKVTRRGTLNYEFSKDGWTALVKYFKKHKIKVEGAGVQEAIGIASLAAPIEMDARLVRKIAEDCPTKIIALEMSKK